MLYLVLFILAAICGCAYAAFIMSHVPGAAEERFGRLEALPDDLGQWRRVETGLTAEFAKAAGLWREERLLAHERNHRLLVRQVRFRSRQTNVIVRVDAEEIIQRRRLR
jgi:hypothetical protein